MKLSLQRLDVLVWVLIYGGLLALAVGLSLRREFAGAAGAIIGGGAVAVALGVALIVVRARRPTPERDSAPPPKPHGANPPPPEGSA